MSKLIILDYVHGCYKDMFCFVLSVKIPCKIVGEHLADIELFVSFDELLVRIRVKLFQFVSRHVVDLSPVRTTPKVSLSQFPCSSQC